MSKGSGKEMAVSSGKGVTGGAKKIITFVVGFFVLMAVVPNLDPLMSSAADLGGAVVTIVNALVGLCQQIAGAFASVGGGQ